MWYVRFYLNEAFEAVLPHLIRWVSLSLAGTLLVGGIFWFLFAQVNHSNVLALTATPMNPNNHQVTALTVAGSTTISTVSPTSPNPVAPVTPRPVTSPGNTYAAGNCTWYAKQRRPDLPNNLGDAYNWVSRTRAQGLPTGTEAKVGAIGQRGDHVVYVEQVNGDATVYISEMNYTGYGQISHRTLPATSFTYIY